MSDAEIVMTTRVPEPPRADFAFYIDFKRGEGSPSRVFLATHLFIKACERLDRALVKSVDGNIETVMVLEDIETGSLKTWLRNALTSTDDAALKSLDWKEQVGAFLVKAKYAILRWTDEEGEAPRNLPALAREIQDAAAETDVRHLPDYSTPSPMTLLEAIKDFEGVKEQLTSGDRAKFISAEGELEINLRVRLNIQDIEALAVRETVVQPRQTLILWVKKPDFLGESQWDLRHGTRVIHARIADEAWLRRFQSREVSVLPGDALKCEVEIEHLYGHDNELISERYTVLQVLEVLPNRFVQTKLFGEGE